MKKAVILIIFWIIFVACYIAYGEDVPIIGVASYYSVESSSNITASGEVFKEEGLTCAYMDVPFNSILKVTNIDNGKSVIVRVNDTGNFKKKYNRMIDLSKGAFSKIADLENGLIRVKIEWLK